MTRTMVASGRLSSRQQSVLDCITEYTRTTGFPPTMRDIASRVGLTSPSAAAYQVRSLARIGRIERVPGRPRALRVVEDEPSTSDASMLVLGLADRIARARAVLRDDSNEDRAAQADRILGGAE